MLVEAFRDVVVVEAECGLWSSCALSEDGVVFVWGKNVAGSW